MKSKKFFNALKNTTVVLGVLTAILKAAGELSKLDLKATKLLNKDEKENKD